MTVPRRKRIDLLNARCAALCALAEGAECKDRMVAPEEAVGRRLRLLRDLLEREALGRRREVEQYVACPIGAELQKRLGEFLSANPDLDEEWALALLLERGVQKSEDDRKEVERKKAVGSMRPFPKRGPPDNRSVAESVVLTLDDDLRDRLEEFILTHPGDVESAITSLVGVGLDTVKKDPGVFDPARVIEGLKNEDPPNKVGADHRRRVRAEQLTALLRSVA